MNERKWSCDEVKLSKIPCVLEHVKYSPLHEYCYLKRHWKDGRIVLVKSMDSMHLFLRARKLLSSSLYWKHQMAVA